MEFRSSVRCDVVVSSHHSSLPINERRLLTRCLNMFESASLSTGSGAGAPADTTFLTASSTEECGLSRLKDLVR